MPRKVVRKPKPAAERKPARPPAFLNEVQKLFVVDRLAEFDTLKQVREAFLERFGREILTTTVEHYDPTRAGSKRLRQDLAARFHARREEFKTMLEHIPLANRATRLKERSRIYERQATKGNDKMALTALDGIQGEMDAVERAKRPGGLMGATGSFAGKPVNILMEFPGSEAIDALFDEVQPAMGEVRASNHAAAPVSQQQLTPPAPVSAAALAAHHLMAPAPAASVQPGDDFFDDMPPELR